MSKKEEELKGWVATQHRTFTRWCNMILAKHQDKLELKGLVYPPDFASGYPLLVLLECLVPAHKQFKNQQDHDTIKKAATRFVQLDSTTRGFQFLKDTEHFNFVNVGPTDIVDSNLKITLGFIWQLILHYQIAQKLSGEAKQKDIDAAKSAAKKNLLDWVNSQIVPQGVSGVNNFGKDWNNGIALSALNESLYPEMQDLDAVKKRAGSDEGRLENAKEALGVAVGTMGLPRLIEPEDLVASEPDELSLMTLISVYRENVERIKGVRSSGLAADEARKRAEEEKRRAEREAAEEARRRAEEEARHRAEEEARRKAEEEARHRAEEEAKRRAAEEEARRKAAEVEARRRAEEEARHRAEEEARHRAEEEAKRRAAEEEAKRRAAEEEAKRRAAEEEARRRAAEEEARRRAAEEEARRRAEEEERNRKPPKKQFVMSLKSNMNHYLSAEKEMGQIVANRDKAQVWEYFIVEPLDATGVPIRIRTWHGSYLVANENASVSAYAPGQYNQGADVWFITRESNQNTVIKTGYGGVLTAQDGWGGAVIITNDPSNPMANWRMTKIKAVTLRSYFGKFLRADKKGEVSANREDAGESETWTLERAPVSSGPGKAFYLKSYHGKYLCAELKKFKIVADREKTSDWETWWITKEGKNGQVTLRSYHGKYLCSEKKKGEVNGDRDKASDWEQWTMFSRDLTKGSSSGVDWFAK